jgi:hypothetical protein
LSILGMNHSSLEAYQTKPIQSGTKIHIES